MLSKAKLDELAEKYQAKADRAFNDYQLSGVSRYDRERRNAEDMADAFRAAANAAEDHAQLGHLRAEILWYATQADTAIVNNAPREKLVEILDNIIAVAVLSCNYAKRERPSEKGGA